MSGIKGRVRIHAGGFVRAAMAAALWFPGSAAAQSPNAQPHCTPVGGSVMTNFITPDTTLGTATGDLRGAVSGVAPRGHASG